MSWFEKRLQRLAAKDGYQKPNVSHDSLKLDSNENYVIPEQLGQEMVSEVRADIRRYPLGGTQRLIDAISRFVRVPPAMIGVGNGSDQILDMILGNFASKKTRILTSRPTFGFFENRCKLYDIPVIEVPFSHDMKLDMNEFLKESDRADMIYLDSPNNPTGFQFAKTEMQDMIKSFGGLIIIDEAYGEFGSYSVSNMAKTQDNLITVRTLSKSFGLAGLRLGYFVSSRRFADVFNRVIQYPYPLGTISIEAGIMALKKTRQIRDAIKSIRSERRRIINTLRKHDAFEVFDSKANFVLFDAHSSYKRIYTALSEQGISIRQLGRIGSHQGCLRVTVGTREMNSRFLLAVRDLLG